MTVIGFNTSYAIPIFLRITYGHKTFKPGPFNLGRFSRPVGTVAVLWSVFASIVLLFPLDPRIHSSTDMSMLYYGDERQLTLFPIDYAVVIILGVFMLSALSWVLSARKWFKGPIPNVSADEMAKAGGHVLGGIHSEPPVDKLSEVQNKTSDKSLDTKLS